MKIQYIFFALLLILCGCSDKDVDGVVKLSKEYAEAPYNGNTGLFKVDAKQAWTAQSSDRWIRVITKSGDDSKALHYEVMGNLSTKPRQGTIHVTTGDNTVDFVISQDARPDTAMLVYKLPVIIHVLYYDENDPRQNPPYEKIVEKLNMANALLRHAGKNDPNDPNDPVSEDLGVEFVLATRDPQGNLLKEPGVIRTKWFERNTSSDIFMYSKDPRNIALLWDPNEYVNVMFYNFKQELVAGVSTFPVLPEKYKYKHLLVSKVNYVPGEKLKDVRCVSINSYYVIDNDPAVEVGTTLAHELGHYLGLRHTFSEEPDEKKNELITCHDTDGCEDTPSYNRVEYNKYIDYVVRRRAKDPKFKAEFDVNSLFYRQSCTGEKFLSRNLMDYDYCKKNLFTKDQKAIVRRVLEHALFMPGPKFDDNGNVTRASGYSDEDYNLPFATSKCPEMIRLDLTK